MSQLSTEYQVREQLFKVLYEDNQEPIERYLVKWVHNQEDASELCQETFAYFWQFLLTKETVVQPVADYKGRLYTTAKYRAIDYLRRKKPIGYLSMLESDPAELTVEGHEGRICDSDEFQKALAQLPLRQQQIVRLIDQGLKKKQIAAELGISASAVSMNMNSAKAQLRKSFPVTIDLRDYEDCGNGLIIPILKERELRNLMFIRLVPGPVEII